MTSCRSKLLTIFCTLAFLPACGGGGGGGGGAPTVTVTSTPAVYWSQSVRLTATVTGTNSPDVNWSVESADGGNISADGIYTAPAGSGDFVVRATSRTNRTVSDTTTITVLEPPAGGVPMTTAHRTSGVAPLAVFFDAVNDTAASTPKFRFAWSSGVTQPTDPEGARYVWDFDDPTSGNWSTTNGSKNSASGYTAAHVYETPGIYHVTLTVTDPANPSVSTIYTQTITVDPFDGTTYYVAANGSDSNDGRDTSTPFLSLERGMTALLAASGDARLLLRRGDSFSATMAHPLTREGVNIVGAYADGTPGHGETDARPRIAIPDLDDVSIFSPRGTGNDWRFVDLEFVGPGLASNTGAVGPSPEQQGVNTLQLRLKYSGDWKVAVGWSYWAATARELPHDGQFVVGCEVTQTSNVGFYVGGRRLALLGNTITDGRNTHLVRVWQAHKAVISHNAMLRAGGQRHALKLHGIEPTFPKAAETRWVSITDNIFEGSATSQWTVSMGSQSDVAGEASAVSHMIFERNTFTASPSTVADIESEASNAMVRNNLFDDSLGSGITAIIWQQRNRYIKKPADVRLYNNTAYHTATFLQTNSTLSNARVRNNLVARPGNAPALVTGTAGKGYVQDHNVLTAEAADSVFTLAAGHDFSLPVGSPGVDAGVTLGDVLEDIEQKDRPLGGGWDAGAYESR